MNDKKKPAVADTERRYYALVHPSADLGRPVKGVIDLDADPEPHYYHFSDKDLLRKELTEDFEPGEILFLSDIGQKLPENHSTILDTGDFVVTGSLDSRDVYIWSRVSEADILKRVRCDYDVVTGAQSQYSDLVEDIALRHMEELKNERSKKEMDDIAHALGDGFTWRAKDPTSTGDVIPFRLDNIDYDIGSGYSKAITAISVHDGKLDIEVSDLSAVHDENGWTVPGEEYISPHSLKQGEIEPEEWVEEIRSVISEKFKARIDDVVAGRIKEFQRMDILRESGTDGRNDTSHILADDDRLVTDAMEALRQAAKEPGKSGALSRFTDYGADTDGHNHAYSFEVGGNRYDFISNLSDDASRGYGENSIRIRHGGEYTDMTTANYHISSHLYSEFDYAIGKTAAAYRSLSHTQLDGLLSNVFTDGRREVSFLGPVRLSDGCDYVSATAKTDYDGEKKIFVNDSHDESRNFQTLSYDDRLYMNNAIHAGLSGESLMEYLRSNVTDKSPILFDRVFHGQDGRRYKGVGIVNVGMGQEYALQASDGRSLPVRDLSTAGHMDTLLRRLLIEKTYDVFLKNITPGGDTGYAIPVNISRSVGAGNTEEINSVTYTADDTVMVSGFLSLPDGSTAPRKSLLVDMDIPTLEKISKAVEDHFQQQEKKNTNAIIIPDAGSGRWSRESHKREELFRDYGRMFQELGKRAAQGSDVIDKDYYVQRGSARDKLLLTMYAQSIGANNPVFGTARDFHDMGLKIRTGVNGITLPTDNGSTEKLYEIRQTDIFDKLRNSASRETINRQLALLRVGNEALGLLSDLEDIVDKSNWAVPIEKVSPEEMKRHASKEAYPSSIANAYAFYSGKDNKIYVKGRPQDRDGSVRRACAIITALINSRQKSKNRLSTFNTAFMASLIEYGIDPKEMPKEARDNLNVIDNDLWADNPDYVRKGLGGASVADEIFYRGKESVTDNLRETEQNSQQEEGSRQEDFSLSDHEVSKDNEQDESQGKEHSRGLHL